MDNPVKIDLKDNIADTLLITLYAKSVETKHKQPLIVDHTACELVEKLDYDFSKYKNTPASTVGVAIRASHFDEQVRNFIEKKDMPVVVMVGCGLDTRLQRLGKDAEKACFYELDIPEVIKARKQVLPPLRNEKLLAASMLETKWMDILASKHPEGDFIFIIEGVLMYFTEEDNRNLFHELASRFSGAEIHFDVLNKWMSKKSAKHDTVKKTKARFKSGIDKVEEIESWHPALQFKETYLFSDFKGWRRMGFMISFLMSIVPQFKTSGRLLAFHVAKN